MNQSALPEQAFHRALLDPEQPAPDGLIAWNSSNPEARFNVYRNNVIVSLIEALESTFTVTLALVGATFFRAMAHAYVRENLPNNPVLSSYGESLPAFIEQFEPAASLPYLADTARLEWLRVRAYHAADARPIEPGALQSALSEPDRLPQLQVHFHPSAQLLQSRYGAASLWGAHQGLMPIAQVDPYQAEQALILRPELEVEVIPLDAATAAFSAALMQGMRLGEALETTLARHADFDLNTALIILLKRQALVSLVY